MSILGQILDIVYTEKFVRKKEEHTVFMPVAEFQDIPKSIPPANHV